MDEEAGEVVLLTGSSGFLGSHVLRQLLEDRTVREIRALDKRQRPCNNNNNNNGDLTYEATGKKVKLHESDLSELESCREAFRGVDVVLHCAGLVDYDYPVNAQELDKNNVSATRNVVRLCVEEGVSRLVHCSTTEVTLQSCFTGGIVAVSIFKQESKLEAPSDEEKLIFGEYAASKLRAERIALRADGSPLANGRGRLRVTVLRPTLLYGDGDSHLLPRILDLASSRGDRLPRFWGIGGKQQVTYVGNAAWAFIRAKETLRRTPDAIAGLPITITDDTLVEDLSHFCERMTRSSENGVKVSSWPMPLALAYVAAWFYEFLSRFNFVKRLGVSPTSTVAFLGSIVLYNRARASIHMNYWPKYTHEQTQAIASKYYGELRSKEQ